MMKRFYFIVVFLIVFLLNMLLSTYFYTEASFTFLLLDSILLAFVATFIPGLVRKTILKLNGQVFVSLKEIKNIWNQFNSLKLEKEIWQNLDHFAEKMLGKDNYHFYFISLTKEQQLYYINQFGDHSMQTGYFLDKDKATQYFDDIASLPAGEERFDRDFPHIYPMTSHQQWYGHISLNKKAERQLKDREYGNIFTMIVNQALSLVEKIRNLELTHLQSKNLLRLLSLSKSISEIVNLDELLNKILETLGEIIPFDAGGIFLIDDKNEYFYARKIRGYAIPDIEKLNVKLELGIIGIAIRDKKTVVVKEAKSDPNYYNLREETNSQLTTPLFVGDEVIGVFSLESNQKDYFEAQDIDYLDGFAGFAAIAIRNAKLFHDSEVRYFLESEMINAAQVQSALLPKHYTVPKGYDIYSTNIPSLQVGGDIYDLGKNNDSFLLAIGDVSGKGTSGAILMAVLFAGLRSTLKVHWEVRKNIEQLNQLMVESTIAGKYATFFLAKLNPSKNELWFCNAGHNAPLLFKADDTVQPLDKGGIVLGFIKETDFEEEMLHIDHNDIIVFFTDGLEEAMNYNDEEYGTERIREMVIKNREKDSKQISDVLLADVSNWVGDRGLQDDLTLIILKRK